MVEKNSAVAEAKDVVRSHESYAMANDLDGVMSNIANDIVLLAADNALVEGAKAFRDFYSGMIAAGQQDFGHDCTGEATIGNDVVILNGVSRGSLTASDGTVSNFSNNFIHILKRGEDGQFKIWRASFAPDGSISQ